MLFQEARSLGQQTGVPAPVFYALGRDGSVPTLDELLDVPIYELRTAIEEAAADGVIDLEPLGDVHAVVDRLAAKIVEHATQAAPDGSGLGDVLAASGIQPEIISEVLCTYHRRVPGANRSSGRSFGDGGEAAEGLPDGSAQEVSQAVRVSEVLGRIPPCSPRDTDLRHEGRWQTAEDLNA